MLPVVRADACHMALYHLTYTIILHFFCPHRRYVCVLWTPAPRTAPALKALHQPSKQGELVTEDIIKHMKANVTSICD